MLVRTGSRKDRLSRRLAPALLSLLALVILSCGGSRRGGADAAGDLGRAGHAVQAPIPIKVYAWDNEYAVQAATAAFNAAQREVRAELVLIPWKEYQNRLFIALASGEEIDVFFMREMEAFAIYVDKGLAHPLDGPIAGSGLDLSAYGSYVEQLKVGGRTYALPYRGAGLFLFYNREAFETAGLEPPDGAWTWAEYRAAAKALSAGSGPERRYGSFMEPSMYYIPLMPALQAGVRIVTDDRREDLRDPAFRRALLLYRALTVEDRSQPTQAEMKANNMTTSSAFISGKAAMTLAGEWFVGRLNAVKEAGELGFSWGMTRLPCDEPTYAGSGLATKGCVGASTRKSGPAFAYLSWVAGLEGQKVIAVAGSKPALLTPEIEEALAARMGLDAEERRIFFEVPPVVVNQPSNLGATHAKQILEEELAAFYSGARGADEAIARCASRLDAALAEYR